MISNDDDSVTDDASKTLAEVRKLVVNGKTDVSLSELLTLAHVESADYCQALAISSRGNTVVLKWEPCDCNISNYNSAVMLAWQANRSTICNECLCMCHVCGLMHYEK